MTQHTSQNRSMVREAMRAPYLERDEEHELAVRWIEHGESKALHKLIAAHMRLVISMASRFRNFGLPMADLIQEGHVGLLEAARRFEPAREVRFSTYATWWIRASIQDYILRNWSIVRGGTSSNQKALFFNLRRLRAKLSGGPDRRPDSELHAEIADAIGVSLQDVETMNARLSGSDSSLNAPVMESDSGNTTERQDMLMCDQPLPDETVGRAIDAERRKRWINSALKVLSDRELQIIRERRRSEEQVTLEALGQSLGISKERVRQIESRALGKLRTALLAELPDGETAMI